MTVVVVFLATWCALSVLTGIAWSVTANHYKGRHNG